MKKRYLIAGAYGLTGAWLAAKLLSRPRDVEWTSHAASLHHADQSWFVEVDRIRVHYQEAGRADAPVVLLIHGFCASNFIWSDVLLPIAGGGYRVIAPDLIGYGFSEKPRDGEYTIKAQAQMIVGLMNALGISRAALVGSSYGAAVAATCALDYPNRVERLVLVGAVSNNEVKSQLLLRLAASPVLGDLLSPVLIDSRALMQWRMKKVYAEEHAHLLDAERMDAHHRPLRTANTHRAILQTLRRWDAARLEREAHLITQSTLLVWGEQDRDVPVHHGERLHAQILNSRLIVFRRCGHLPQEERPAEFAGLIAGFCQSMKARGSSVDKDELSTATNHH